MQKKIIALAVAGLVSGAAFAQSNVTIYGVMDLGVYGWSGNDQSATGVQSNGLSTSRLGFKGSEDLGNGLKAVFNLESAIDPDNKKGWASDRQANVGLSGGFGTVLIGIQGSLSDKWHGDVSETMGNISSRNLTSVVGNFSNEKADGVAYYSPIFSGLQLGLLYGTKEDTDTDTTSRSYYYQLGANYANGPFAAAMTYAQLKEGSFGDASRDWTLGATYDFKVVKLYAAYELSQNVGVNRKDDNALYTLGARVPVSSAGTVSASYSRNNNDARDTDNSAWQLGYDHALSKRTTWYAAYMRISNDDNGTVRPNGRYDGAVGFTGTGENYHGFTVGLRHLF